MSRQPPKGPFCQSCAMPLEKPEDFGTDVTGYRVNDYCRFCFTNGAFTEPHVSMQAMIDKCVGIMGEQGIMPPAQARPLMSEVIPKLKRWRVAGTAVLVALLLAGSGAAAAQQVGQTVIRRGTITEDLYLAGGTVEVDGNVQGDVVAAGGRVLIAQRVTGDVIAAGGVVEVSAEVLDDVRAAGGTVTLRGPITGDAIATGGTVELRPDATVGGRAWFGGGTVDVGGRVMTHLKAGAEQLVISGTVGGDVDVTAERIEIGPTARITGSLTYRSPREARIDPAAQIGGGITRLPLHRPSLAQRIAGRLLGLAAVGVLGAALILAFPGVPAGAVQTLGDHPWKAVGVGAGVFVGGPVLVVLLLVTIVGAVLGAAVLVVYGLALVAGWLGGALFVGDVLLRLARRGERAPSAAMWIGALLAGLLVVGLLRLIPLVGWLLCLGVLLAGLGALGLRGYEAWRASRSSALLARPATAQ